MSGAKFEVRLKLTYIVFRLRNRKGDQCQLTYTQSAERRLKAYDYRQEVFSRKATYTIRRMALGRLANTLPQAKFNPAVPPSGFVQRRNNQSKTDSNRVGFLISNSSYRTR